MSWVEALGDSNVVLTVVPGWDQRTHAIGQRFAARQFDGEMVFEAPLITSA